MAVLIETMRREGYEFMVSKPQVITKTENDKILEPVEIIYLDIQEDHVGTITEKLSKRKGRMMNLQNNGFGTEHGYGSAILLGGGLLKKSQIYSDWPGIKKRELFEGRDLNSTLDSRAVYCAAMSACFNVDFKRLNKEVFPDKKLPDLTEKLFKT